MTKFEWILIGIATFIVAVSAEVMLRDGNNYVKYDCRLVNTSPDIPEDVKRMCRSKR